MYKRPLAIAWVAVLMLFGGVILWAELTYSGRSGGTADPGKSTDGGAIETNAGAVGSEDGAALVGQPKQGEGPAGQADAIIELPEKTPSAVTTAPTSTAPARPESVAATRPAPPRVAFAATLPPDDGRPRIAIVMGQIGIGAARSRHAIERLPPEITFAIAAYSEGAASWIRDARANGHETLLSIPMEPIDYPRDDPGPKPLLIDLDDLENLSRLEKALSGVSGYVGLLSHMGSRFLANPDRTRPILAATADKGLIFVDSRSGPDSAVSDLAPTVDLHLVLNDRFIDDIPSRDDIDKRLGELEAIATRRGFAVGLSSPYPVTIERLRTWAKSLDERGFVLTPITGVARRLTP